MREVDADHADHSDHSDHDDHLDDELLSQLRARGRRAVSHPAQQNGFDEQRACGLDDSLAISAKTGTGLDALRARLLEIVGLKPPPTTASSPANATSPPCVAADEHLQMAYAHALTQDQKLDLFAEELRLAQEAAQRHHRRIHRRRPAGRDFLQFLYW